jgi:hypothetical protein
MVMFLDLVGIVQCSLLVILKPGDVSAKTHPCQIKKGVLSHNLHPNAPRFMLLAFICPIGWWFQCWGASSLQVTHAMASWPCAWILSLSSISASFRLRFALTWTDVMGVAHPLILSPCAVKTSYVDEFAAKKLCIYIYTMYNIYI